MISIFSEMTPAHYDEYIDHFHVEDPAGRCDLVMIQLILQAFVILLITILQALLLLNLKKYKCKAK